MPRLLGIGDNTVDLYLDEGMQYPGGNAVNVAVLARRNGAAASYLGCLGKDALGELISESLAAEGVDISHCRHLDGPNSWSRVRHEGGDRLFAGSNPGIRACYKLTDEDFAFMAEHDIVHTSVHSGLDTEMPRLAAAAKLLSYDYSEHWQRPGVASTFAVVGLAFLSCPRRPLAECEALLRSVAAQGPSVVVATRGSAGACALEGGRLSTYAVEPVDAVDTLGAGDGFIAGFLLAYVSGLGIDAALERGAQLAAKVCSHKGAFGHGTPILPGQPGTDASKIVRRDDAAQATGGRGR
jgi:fructoselysine 6-kinase